KVADVGEEDLCLQDPRPVAACLCEQAVDRGEHLARLRTDVDRRILGDLAGQVDHPVVDAGLGHPRADVQALNRHDSSWDRKRSTASIWSRAMNVGAWPTPSKAMHCAPGPR